MPSRLNQDRRHRIPRQKHKVTNPAACDAALRWRGGLTVWFTVPRPQSHRNGERRTYGGEWLQGEARHQGRSWRKLHSGLDAGSGQIVAASLTAKQVDDGAAVGPLLDQIAGAAASFMGDGGYDQDRVYASVAERHPEAAVIVPPRVAAVPSETAETAPAQRNRHLQQVKPRASPDIAKHRRAAWLCFGMEDRL